MRPFNCHQEILLCLIVLLLFGLYFFPRSCSLQSSVKSSFRYYHRLFNRENELVHSAKGNVTYDELEEKVYMPLGYRIKEATIPIPTLQLIQEQTCDQIFFEYNQIANKTPDTPPNHIPYYKREQYTMFGYAFLVEDYRNEKLTASNYKWSNIEELVKKEDNDYVKYGTDGQSVLYAMKAFPPTNQNGIIIGSLQPWVEVFALRTGAKMITTVEYANLEIVKTDRVKFLKATELAKNYKDHVEKYDFSASFSSVEHSGLGRFGDPMDPIGDLRELRKIRCLLKKGGLLYLGVPRGEDTLYFNLHRIYGRIRLAMMFAGFEWLGTFRGSVKGPVDFSVEDTRRSRLIGSTQDTFVLRKL